MIATIGKDILAQQDAREIVRGAWGSTPSGSVADDWQKRVIPRIEEKLDVMGAMVDNRLKEEA